jgi:hypothetical protein
MPPSPTICQAVIRHHFLDDHGRRERIEREMIRIHHRHPLDRRKPYVPSWALQEAG